MASPKFVTYHQHGVLPKKFAVLKEHKDGTADIGPEGGEAVVTGVPILKEPKPGHCTHFVEESEKADETDDTLESKKVEQLRELATSLSINVSGLKKDELIAAIKSAQAK